MHNLVSVQLQDFVTHREEQEDSHPKAADSGAYTGKPPETYQPLQFTAAKEQDVYETIHKNGPQNYEGVATEEVVYEIPQSPT